MYGEHHESGGLGHVDDHGLTLLAASRKPFSTRGLAPPVSITLQVSNAPMAEEAEWQERVNRHLGLREWEVREVGATICTAWRHSPAALKKSG
jgi:hypothetical protein